MLLFRSFLVKFDNVEDLVSASECVDSDGNMTYDCVNYHCKCLRLADLRPQYVVFVV